MSALLSAQWHGAEEKIIRYPFATRAVQPLARPKATSYSASSRSMLSIRRCSRRSSLSGWQEAAGTSAAARRRFKRSAGLWIVQKFASTSGAAGHCSAQKALGVQTSAY